MHHLQLATGCAQQRGGERGLHGRKDLAIVRGSSVLQESKNTKPTFLLRPIRHCPGETEQETSDIANGPCNLLENMDLYVNYRKTLTTYAWGMLIWESIDRLSGMTGKQHCRHC